MSLKFNKMHAARIRIARDSLPARHTTRTDSLAAAQQRRLRLPGLFDTPPPQAGSGTQAPQRSAVRADDFKGVGDMASKQKTTY